MQNTLKPDQKWKEWIFDYGDELYVENDERNWSIFLCLAGVVFAFLRRFNVWENIKHIVPALHPHKKTHAWATDAYIVVTWIVLGLFVTNAESLAGHRVSRYLALWWILQTVQCSVYPNVWRLLLFLPDHPMGMAISSIRNLFIGICNFVVISVLFGLVYFWSGTNAFTEQLQTVGDAIYFSFVTGATVGFGDIRPKLGEDFVQAIVVGQIVTSLCMVAIVIAQAINAVGTLKDRRTARLVQRQRPGEP